MKLGRLLRGLGTAGVAVLVSAPVGAGVAHAAPAPPPAYAALARAYPLFWSGAGLSVGDLRVPYVSVLTNNLTNSTPVADADAVLTKSDLTKTTMSGEEIKGLTCTGFEETRCKDPFLPEAKSVGSARLERSASFEGREGKFPGRIHSLVDCLGDCAKDVIRSSADASGAKGGVETYFTVGGSSASQDLSLDDRGRLVSLARSSLSDVAIGPSGEVRFSRLNTTASALGAGADNSKEGRADVRIENFVILDNPVELTRAGLRLAGGGPSEQEAYDGAKALLERLKTERGITLGLPDFAAQVQRKAEHVTVQAQGLRVHFERSVQGPQGVQTQGVASDLELGTTTALVAATEQPGNIEVRNGDVVVESSGDLNEVRTPAAPPPPSVPRAGGTRPAETGPPLTRVKPTLTVGPPASDGPPGQVEAPPSAADDALASPPLGPENQALPDIRRALGLRDARAVSRAFGAFIGLGLILPIARLVIRRFG
jgi:hypothetical protein